MFFSTPVVEKNIFNHALNEIGKRIQIGQTEPEGVYRYAEFGEVCSKHKALLNSQNSQEMRIFSADIFRKLFFGVI